MLQIGTVCGGGCRRITLLIGCVSSAAVALGAACAGARATEEDEAIGDPVGGVVSSLMLKPPPLKGGDDEERETVPANR
jgi:hypothetical protein